MCCAFVAVKYVEPHIQAGTVARMVCDLSMRTFRAFVCIGGVAQRGKGGGVAQRDDTMALYQY